MKSVAEGERSRLVALVLAFVLVPLLTTARPALARDEHAESLMPRAGVVKAPPPRKIDWKKTTDEAAQFLSKYIQIDTSAPQANEAKAATMLKEKFLSDGIPATTWQPSPGHEIVAARLRGIGRKRRAIILLNYMDLPPANPKHWKVPPFSGAIKGGYVWGRGAVYGKGPGVVDLMAMLAIKRSGILLDRDVLFVATGDKQGHGKQGAEWFANNEKDIYSDAGYLLGDGGGVIAGSHGGKVYAVSVTEKTPLWLRLIATGPGTPGFSPAGETSVTRLVGALARLIQYQPDIHVLNPVQDYFRAIAKINNGPKEWRNLVNSLRDPSFARKFVAVPYQNALVRDTIAPTVLMGSSTTNMVPATAYADVDCRLLPRHNVKAFIDKIRKVIADKSIKIKVLFTVPSTSSPQKSLLMNAIEKLAQQDKSQAVPMVSAGFTNCPYFRMHRIIAYGFTPLTVSSPEQSGVAGPNERIAVKDLGDAVRRMVTLLKIFGGRG